MAPRLRKRITASLGLSGDRGSLIADLRSDNDYIENKARQKAADEKQSKAEKWASEKARLGVIATKFIDDGQPVSYIKDIFDKSRAAFPDNASDIEASLMGAVKNRDTTQYNNYIQGGMELKDFEKYVTSRSGEGTESLGVLLNRARLNEDSNKYKEYTSGSMSIKELEAYKMSRRGQGDTSKLDGMYALAVTNEKRITDSNKLAEYQAGSLKASAYIAYLNDRLKDTSLPAEAASIRQTIQTVSNNEVMRSIDDVVAEHNAGAISGGTATQRLLMLRSQTTDGKILKSIETTVGQIVASDRTRAGTAAAVLDATHKRAEAEFKESRQRLENAKVSLTKRLESSPSEQTFRSAHADIRAAFARHRDVTIALGGSSGQNGGPATAGSDPYAGDPTVSTGYADDMKNLENELSSTLLNFVAITSQKIKASSTTSKVSTSARAARFVGAAAEITDINLQGRLGLADTASRMNRETVEEALTDPMHGAKRDSLVYKIVGDFARAPSKKMGDTEVHVVSNEDGRLILDKTAGEYTRSAMIKASKGEKPIRYPSWVELILADSGGDRLNKDDVAAAFIMATAREFNDQAKAEMIDRIYMTNKSSDIHDVLAGNDIPGYSKMAPDKSAVQGQVQFAAEAAEVYGDIITSKKYAADYNGEGTAPLVNPNRRAQLKALDPLGHLLWIAEGKELEARSRAADEQRAADARMKAEQIILAEEKAYKLAGEANKGGPIEWPFQRDDSRDEGASGRPDNELLGPGGRYPRVPEAPEDKARRIRGEEQGSRGRGLPRVAAPTGQPGQWQWPWPANTSPGSPRSPLDPRGGVYGDSWGGGLPIQEGPTGPGGAPKLRSITEDGLSTIQVREQEAQTGMVADPNSNYNGFGTLEARGLQGSVNQPIDQTVAPPSVGNADPNAGGYSGDTFDTSPDGQLVDSSGFRVDLSGR